MKKSSTVALGAMYAPAMSTPKTPADAPINGVYGESKISPGTVTSEP